MTLQNLLLQAWTKTPPARHEEDGVEWFEVRVMELPDFFVAAPTADEANAEYKAALTAFLASYVADGKTPPLPERKSWAMKPPLYSVGVQTEGPIQVRVSTPPPAYTSGSGVPA